MQIPIRVLIHIRNPFDMITTQVIKRKKPLKKAVQRFPVLERRIAVTCNRLTEDEKFLQRHEDIIADPKEHFTKMYEFLGVEPIKKVVDACADKIWKKPNQTRRMVL